MFEELERFPIKAGFSQQASCQICFSIISFNWDPRFCETYTCDLKIKILEQVAVFLRQIWDQLGAVAGSFHLLGIFGICFPPPSRPTLVIWYPSHRPLAMLAPCNHLPAGRPSAICTLAKGESAIRETFSGASAGNRSPAETPGNFAWDKRQRGNKRNHWTTIGR